MASLNWHDYLVFASFWAAIAGLILLSHKNQTQPEDGEATERVLLMMSFTYWIVYCVAIGIQKFRLPDWDILLMSLQITAILAYFLTFCCVLILPLHRLASRYVE